MSKDYASEDAKGARPASKAGVGGSIPSTGATSEIEDQLIDLWGKYSYQPKTVAELFNPQLNEKFMPKIPVVVISRAKAAFFPGLDKMPETVIDAFLRWAKENKKDPTKNNKENREMMYNMARFARMLWLF